MWTLTPRPRYTKAHFLPKKLSPIRNTAAHTGKPRTSHKLTQTWTARQRKAQPEAQARPGWRHLSTETPKLPQPSCLQLEGKRGVGILMEFPLQMAEEATPPLSNLRAQKRCCALGGGVPFPEDFTLSPWASSDRPLDSQTAAETLLHPLCS